MATGCQTWNGKQKLKAWDSCQDGSEGRCGIGFVLIWMLVRSQTPCVARLTIILSWFAWLENIGPFLSGSSNQVVRAVKFCVVFRWSRAYFSLLNRLVHSWWLSVMFLKCDAFCYLNYTYSGKSTAMHTTMCIRFCTTMQSSRACTATDCRTPLDGPS